MAYTPVPQWITFPTALAAGSPEENIPTAVLMNIYSDDLDYIHGEMGDTALNYPVPKISGEDFHIFVHRYQWLHYRDSGYLEDITGDPDTRINLSGEGVAVYNLDSVPWLYPGALYRMKQVTFAAESSEP